MTNHLTLFLLSHPRLAGLVGLFVALLFAVLGVSSLLEMSRLPEAPSEMTTAQFAEALQSQDRVWAMIKNPQWDCSTLVQTKTGDDTDSEVFLRDPENSVAVLATFTDPIECADLDPSQVTGVGYSMSDKYIQHLEQEGRLASFRDYRTLAALCTVCGRGNSMSLVVISAIFVVLGLAIYPLVYRARKDMQPLLDSSAKWQVIPSQIQQEIRNASTESLEHTVYRYETGYFKFIGEEQDAVREFRRLIEARDIATLHSQWSSLLKALVRLEGKAGHHGPPLILDYYPNYDLYVRELYDRKTSGET